MKNFNLIFLHIPKNGGTTLYGILDRSYPHNTIHTIQTPDSKTLTTRDFIDLPPSERHKIRLLKGHMTFGLHEYLEQPVKYFTFLRHPVDRIISYYYYVLNRPDHHVGELIRKNMWNLEEFVMNFNQGDGHNAQVRMISGINDTGVNMLEKALDNIENHFAMVGMLEEFDDSLILMKKILKIKTPYYQVMKKGVRKPERDSINEKTIREIRERNQADLQLYDLMQDRFYRKIKEVPDLKTERLKLKALNKIYSVYKRHNISRFLKNWHLYPSENPFR